MLAEHEIIRSYGATTPFVDASHLIGTRHAIPGQPFSKTGNGHVADFLGCNVERDAAMAEEIDEFHDAHIPHSGEHRQPRFGERQEAANWRKIPNMGNRLKELRQNRGWTHEKAADAVGVSRGQFIKLERGERRLTSDYIERVAKAFGISAAEVISESVESVGAVPIVGKAGAGPDGTVLFGTAEGPFDYGPAAPNSTAETRALEVSGDSMRGIASDGWLVYYDDEPITPSSELLGELCVVGLEDDRVLVKILGPGRGPGLFDLESFNAPVMRDVPVRWACLVTSIIPRKPALKLSKRDG